MAATDFQHRADPYGHNTYQERMQLIVVAGFTAVILFILTSEFLPVGPTGGEGEWGVLFQWVLAGTAWVNVVVLYLHSMRKLRHARLLIFPMVTLYTVLTSFLVIDSGSVRGEFNLLYFLPILFASLYYDVVGAVVAAALVCVLSIGADRLSAQPLPRMVMSAEYLLRIPIWMLVALVLGYLSRAERHHRERNTRLLHDAEQKMTELRTLIDVGIALNSTVNIQQLLKLIVELSTHVMHAEAGSLLLVDQAAQQLVFAVVVGEKGEDLIGQRLPMDRGLAGWTATTAEPVLVPDTSLDTRFFAGVDKKSGFSTRSILAVPLRHHDGVLGVLEIINKTGDQTFTENDQDIAMALASQCVVAINNAQLIQDMEAVFLSTVESLATALEFRDTETEGHSRRVREYTLAIARHLPVVPEEKLSSISQGSLLHDIGKIGVPDAILRKPGKLTDEEWVEMRKHTEYGYQMICRIDFLEKAADIVYSHHEKYDGSGYPRGLVGEDIPLGARLFAVADAFDAMTSDRPYRKAMSFADAKDEIRRCSGAHFDPVAVESFLSIDDSVWERIRDATLHRKDRPVLRKTSLLQHLSTGAGQSASGES